MTDRGYLTQEIDDRLLYLPKFRVVICRPCRYAIQPSAFSAHLRRHKIFRRHRQDLLDRLAEYDVVPPEGISYPSSTERSIPELPKYIGFRCLASNCQYLCISEKRLSQHWSQVHRCTDRDKIESRSSMMQTFFRGTCTKYFEVEASVDDSSTDAIASPSSPRSDRYAPEVSSDLLPEEGAKYAAEWCLTSTEIKTLMYMHHFTVSTAETMTLGNGIVAFWSHQLPRLASKHDFLLYSILGTAACHQASEAGTAEEREEHRTAAHGYQSAALASYRIEVNQANRNNAVALAATSRFLGVQATFLCRLDLAHMRKTGQVLPAETSATLLCSFLVLLQGSTKMLLHFGGLFPEDCGLRLSERAFEELQTLTSSQGLDANGVPLLQSSLTSFDRVPAEIDVNLRSLPGRLANVDGVSDNDIVMFVRCCGVLLQAIGMTYRRPEPPRWAAWSASMGFATSLAVQNELIPALKAQRPPAFIVMALFALYLTPRTGESVWFTTGHAEQFLHLCHAGLRDHQALWRLTQEICAEESFILTEND